MNFRYLTMVVLTLAFSSPAAWADQPEAAGELEAGVIERLDLILDRLDQIDQRLAKLEQTQQWLTGWWVDERGVMRTNRGRPIGIWGIDDPKLSVMEIR